MNKYKILSKEQLIQKIQNLESKKYPKIFTIEIKATKYNTYLLVNKFIIIIIEKKNINYLKKLCI